MAEWLRVERDVAFQAHRIRAPGGRVPAGSLSVLVVASVGSGSAATKIDAPS